jgi:serine protease Do
LSATEKSRQQDSIVKETKGMGAFKKTRIVVLAVLSLSLTACTGLSGISSNATSLTPRIMETISHAVYEVVVPKPSKDSLEYEKPLPLDLLPYSVRTDKYYSVGTAFAISPTEFVSAEHVMKLGSGSQYKEVFLRDREGKVHSIEKILKYSKNRDFVVFSLPDTRARKHLQVNKSPLVNQKVYAVGNALGEGIVIRDGLYTSDTPEEEAGEWKWIRFSAAASPGNSGGPLLDQSGNVIGIVLRKSPNENLNYAIPITEVIQAGGNAALLQMRGRYTLSNMEMTKIDTLKKEIKLPRTYEELNSEVNGIMAQFYEKLLKDLLSENRDVIFPRGPGSTRLFHKSYDAVFPHLIMKGKDGQWDAYYAREPREADLGKNGRLSYGVLGNMAFMYLRKPDDIPLEKLYGDSKLFMDLILKGGGRFRKVGTENIKVTSMGNAFEEYRFTDSYGRIWIVRTWLAEYNDRKVATLSLPVPGGYVIMMSTGETGSVDQELIPDMKALSDFVYVSYYGTFKDWQGFVSRKDLLPPQLANLDIQIKKGEGFRYASSRLSLSYGPDLMGISDDSDLRLDFSFFQEQGKTVWDVNRIVVNEEKYNQVGYTVSRKMKPPKELGDQYESHWGDMVKGRFPFNRSAYYEDKVTIIAATYVRDDKGEKKDGPPDTVLYTAGFMKEGRVDQKEMETKLNLFMRNLMVYENSEGDSRAAGSPRPVQ